MSSRKLITDNIVATLQGITILAGYSFDMGEVRRKRYQFADWGGNEKWPKTCIYSSSETSIPRIGWNIYDHNWSVGIRLFYKGDDADEAIDGFLYDVRDSMLRCSSLTRGNLAWNTCYTGTTEPEDTFEEDRHHCSTVLNFLIWYREIY